MPMIERYVWSVLYRDGRVLSEYEADGTHHSFTEVDVAEAVQLTVHPNGYAGWKGPSFVVPCHAPEVRPIMFRTVAVNMQTGDSRRWHVFGWQKTVDGRNVKALSYISNDDEDGTEYPKVILTDAPLDIG